MKLARRLFRSTLLVPTFLACQRPHVCGASCEAGIVPSAPVAASLWQEDGWSAAEALEAFDQAWKTIHDSHFDRTFNGVDWEALKVELRPRAERTQSRAELREVLGEMLARLGQSHFVVIPSDALPEDQPAAEDQSGGLGFDVRLRAGKLLVVSVEPGSPAAAAGVQRGWSVERIGTLDVGEFLARLGAAPELGERRAGLALWTQACGQLFGPIGTQAEVEFRAAEDQPIRRTLTRAKREVSAHQVSSTLPTFYLRFQSEALERDGKRIGYLTFSNWFLPVVKPLDEAVEKLRGSAGMVVDLRGNTGGAVAMIMGVAGHFFAQTTKLGVMITRDSTLNILAIPRLSNAAGARVAPFAGPLAILVDETTASASEAFAGGLQAVGRARVFGETSAGAVLPAVPTRLSNGDTLLHALGDFETAQGKRLEGGGVVPDEVVPLTQAALVAGRDEALEAAMAWILTQTP